MKLKIRIVATFAFVALTIGLFSSSPSASAVGVCHNEQLSIYARAAARFDECALCC